MPKLNKKFGSKKKGNSFELKIAKEIAATIGVPYGKSIRRCVGSGALMCRADIYLDYKTRPKFPWYLECKKRENIRLEHLFKPNNYILKWYKESKEKLGIDPEYDPMMTPTALIFAKNNMNPFVLLSKKDFADMEVATLYPKEAPMIFFSDDGEDYIILDWAHFLKTYTVEAP